MSGEGMSRLTTTGPTGAGLSTLVPCEVKLGGRVRRAERGELTVPERRDGPGGRHITLPLVRVRALLPSGRTPVFRLGGGPGLTNMRFGCPAALDGHDVVLVGYRGVDGSTRLDCPEVAAALRLGDLLSPATRRAVAQAAAAAAQRLASSGVDPAGYTVAETLADIDDARTALGYDTVDLLSESYGTRLALLYAQTHPDHVHRSVLIGVNPPGRFVWDPATVDAQLADWGRLWAASGEGRSSDLAGTIRAAAGRMPARWAGRRIDIGKAKILTFTMLFGRKNGLVAIDAWQAAAAGDPSGIALLSLAHDLMVPRLFTWGDFLAKAYSTDHDDTIDYATRLGPPGTALGSPLSLLFFGGGPGWPPNRAPDDLRRLIDCPVPSLLISGDLDVSTPPHLARDEALPYLPAGRQVIVPNCSHVDDIWRLQPDATARLVTGFLNRGAADTNFDATVPPLKPGVRLPAVAKLFVAAVATAAAAVGTATWWTLGRR